MFRFVHPHSIIFLALLLVLASTGQSDSNGAAADGAEMMKNGDPMEPSIFLLEVLRNNDLHDHRELTISSSVPCNGGAGPTYYFSLDFKLKPQGGWNLSQCTSRKMRALGDALNVFLLDYGIGAAGVGDKIAFLAEVCRYPTVSKVARSRGRELITGWSFVYSGGGPCKFCLKDNFDGRRELQLRGRTLQTSTDPNWFNNIFKPQMQNTLRNAFTSSVAPLHKACLGNGPTVDPIITQTSGMVNTSC